MVVRADDRLLRWLIESATVEREDANLANLTVSGNTTTTISASRSENFFITLEISGWSGFGTITVNGLDSSSNPVISQTTFIGNNRMTDTLKQFRSLSSVVTSGFTGSGTIKIWATDQVGQPKEQLTTIKTIKCAITRTRLGEILEPTGGASLNSAKVFMYPNSGVKRNDILTIDGTKWEVKALQILKNFHRHQAMDVAIVFAQDQT